MNAEAKLTLKSFMYHVKKGEVQFQLSQTLSFKPWFNYYSGCDDYSGTEYTNIFAGWLFLQCRWTHV